MRTEDTQSTQQTQREPVDYPSFQQHDTVPRLKTTAGNRAWNRPRLRSLKNRTGKRYAVLHVLPRWVFMGSLRVNLNEGKE